MSARHGATWRSGYAAVCKTVYTSSILVVASINNIKALHSIFDLTQNAPVRGLALLKSSLFPGGNQAHHPDCTDKAHESARAIQRRSTGSPRQIAHLPYKPLPLVFRPLPIRL